MWRLRAGLLAGMLVVLGLSYDASAIVIDFDSEGLVGPSTFAAAGPAQTLNIPTAIGNVTFENGVILTGTTNLPANATSIYGTASFADPTLGNPLVVTFPTPISNFFLDVLNGLTTEVPYQVSDNAGHSTVFSLPPNLSSGQTQIGFAASGDIVSITALSPTGGPATSWDFFIDNIHFNEPLPDQLNPVPEPTTLLLFGTTAAGLGLARWRRNRRT